MIKLYGAVCGRDISALQSELPTQWLAAWDACHKVGKNEKNALLSLSALSLLHRSRADGTLAYDASGRPYFSDRMCDFSITHTQNHVFCAVIDGEEPTRIGIDAEDFGRAELLDIPNMVARWFSDGERELYAASPTPETFLRIWTRKEAFVKYTGEGLRGLQKADTATPGDVCFFDCQQGTILISICAPRGAIPPTEITVLEKEWAQSTVLLRTDL